MRNEDNPYQPPMHGSDRGTLGGAESTIRVKRTSSYADRFREYRILVDGIERDRVKANAVVDIPVDVGNHRVVAKIDWLGSTEVNVESRPNSTTTLECGNNTLRGFGFILAILYIHPYRDQYLTLTHI